MTLIVNGLWRLCSIYRASLASTLGRIAVSAIFTGRLWPPAQRRPVKHTETEKAPRVEARGPASSKTIKAEPANVLALPKTNKADQQVAFSCFQDAVAEAIAEGANKNQKSTQSQGQGRPVNIAETKRNKETNQGAPAKKKRTGSPSFAAGARALGTTPHSDQLVGSPRFPCCLLA